MLVFSLAFFSWRRPNFPVVNPTPRAASNHFSIMQTIPRSNVLVLGRSGSGMSTLVNALLNSNVRKTNPALPCPEPFGSARTPGVQVVFYDGPGLEGETFDKQIKQIESRLKDCNQSFKPQDHFDVVLMVVSSEARWKPADLTLASYIVH
jgi:predicted GTPase